MSEELRPCPFCGKIPKPDWTDESYIECTNRKCDIYSFGMSTGAWNTRPFEDALTARIAELEGIIKSDDERLTEAGLKVNLYFGCDTAEIMAEEILSSRARIAELEGGVTRLLTESDDAHMAEARYIAKDELAKKDTRIAELEAAQRWIPVSERLPKESGWYRVGAINVFYEGYTDEVYFDANKTKSGWQSSVRDEIYCWLDGVPGLPQPPEVQE